jgi:chorismate dehydratase
MVSPEALVPQDAAGEAVLLIGDDALRARRGLPGHEYVYDLGKEWHRLTGLPMVFATWAVRKDTPSSIQRRLLAILETSLDEGLRAIDDIAAVRRDVGLSESGVKEYLDYFVYRAGPEEERAIAAFKEAVGPLPVWRPGDTAC